MFFIGATGQFLTLILTVTLPFMFLVSGHQKIDFFSSQQNFEVEHHSNSEISIENGVNFIAFDLHAEVLNSKFQFKENRVFKRPNKKIGVKWKTFCLNNSGNKAPPVLF